MLHLDGGFFHATSDSDQQMLQVLLLLWPLFLAHSLTLNVPYKHFSAYVKCSIPFGSVAFLLWIAMLQFFVGAM